MAGWAGETVDAAEVGLALAFAGGLREQLAAMAAMSAPVEAAVAMGRGGLAALRVATAALNGSVAAERRRPGQAGGEAGPATAAWGEGAGGPVGTGPGRGDGVSQAAPSGAGGGVADVVAVAEVTLEDRGAAPPGRRASGVDGVTSSGLGRSLERGSGDGGPGSAGGGGVSDPMIVVAGGGGGGAAPDGGAMRAGGAQGVDGPGLWAGAGATAPVVDAGRGGRAEDGRAEDGQAEDGRAEDGGRSAWVAGGAMRASAPEGVSRGGLRADVGAALALAGRPERVEGGWDGGLPGRERPASPAVADGRRGRGAGMDDEVAGVMPGAARQGGAAPLPAGRTGDEGGLGSGGTVMMDGRLVGYWVSEQMAREAARPGAGATFFDARQAPAWMPSGAA